jgi:hypothetical protein
MNENKLLYYYIIVIAQWSQNKNAGGIFYLFLWQNFFLFEILSKNVKKERTHEVEKK